MEMKSKIPRAEFESIIDHPGSGAVLGLKHGKVLLVALQRTGFHAATLEIPGGVCEPHETHEQAARREFLEETGYELGYTFHWQTINPSVGYSNEMISIFYAEIGEKVSNAEHITRWATKQEVYELINEGKIVDAQSLTALSLWLTSELSFDLPSVIFICTGNYYRSRFCEIYYNHLTKGNALPADSKGLWAYRKINDGMISPHTLKFLNDISLPAGKMKFPEQMEARHFQSGIKIIAMDETEHRSMMQKDFPEFSDQIQYWQVHDIDFTDPSEAMPALKKKVELLVKEL